VAIRHPIATFHLFHLENQAITPRGSPNSLPVAVNSNEPETLEILALRNWSFAKESYLIEGTIPMGKLINDWTDAVLKE